jgi:uncharacterized protein YndB with AHSA1/START domain/predicted enzyme related to lactoylglutathione lyase
MSETNTAAPATALVLRRTYKAPRERVFNAWTQPEIMRRWMSPAGTTISEIAFEAQIGAPYRIVMLHADGERFVVRGSVRELRAPEHFSLTWQWEDDDGNLEGNETILSLDFHAYGNETEVVLTHENFTGADQRGRHEVGWTSILEKLPGALRPFSITGMDLSGFMVKDAPRAIAFYRDVLGLEPALIYSGDRGAEYELPDGTTFGLWGGGEGAIPFQPSNGILFAVTDFDAAIAELEARGIPILMRFETPGCFMAAVADTEGNTIMLHKRKTAA